MWQFYSSKNEPVNGPHVYWQDAMELPGANQMKFVRDLMESHSFLDRVPDQSLIIENNNVAAERIQATRGENYLFVYTAAGRSFTLNMGRIKGEKVNAYWYDPRTGKTTAIGAFSNKGTRKFIPPSSGYGRDWVLVVESDGRW
jgi:hypothetical protein